MEELIKIAQSILQREVGASGDDLDLSEVKVFKFIQQDIDGDGQEEILFAAGIPELWEKTTCCLIDLQDSDPKIIELVPIEYGFRDLQVLDINQDGALEILLSWKAGTVEALLIHILKWDSNVLKSLFPTRRFYQGYMEMKDLDADGINEIVIWAGVVGEARNAEPKHFEISTFHYNGQVYEEQTTYTSERCYEPNSILRMRIGGMFSVPLDFKHRLNPIEEYQRQLEVFINNQGVNEEFVAELGYHQEVLRNEGFYEDALIVTNLALEAASYLFNKILQKRWQIAMLRDKGVILARLSDYSNAIVCYRQALSFWSKQVSEYFSPHLHADFVRELGTLYSTIGDYGQALSFLSRAKDIVEKLDESVLEEQMELSLVYANLGETYIGLSNFDFAIEAFKKAVDLDSASDRTTWLVADYVGLGNAQRIAGKYQEAIISYRKALATLDSVSERDTEANVYLYLGLTLILNHQLDEALDCLQKSLLLTTIENLNDQGAIHYTYIGKAYKESGNLQQAMQYFNKAIAVAQELKTPETEWQALYGLALTYQRQGQQQKCQQALEDAINTIEQLRSQYLPETFKISLFAEKTKPYEAMILLRHSASPEQAFDYMERAKSRIFIEQLATTAMGSVAGIPSDLAEQEAQLIGELRRLQLRHRETLSLQKYEWGDEISQIESKLEQLWNDIREISTKGAEYVALRQATPLDFTGVKQIVNAL